MDGKEIELKLAVPADALDTLKRSTVIKRHRQGKSSTRRLTSVYYDTAEGELAEAGVTVRLRAVGQDWLQTVKTTGNRASGLFSREEWEVPVAGEALEPDKLAATGLPLLRRDGLVERLRPVFATEVKRLAYVLGGEDWRVEMAIDTGEIRAGAASQPICEVELELLQGPPSRLFALAHDIAETVPARLLASAKSDRGYDLAAGRVPAPVKSKPVTLDAGMTMADAFRAIARNCLHHLHANEESLLAHGAPEAVHQMRVALRRLRSALKVFRPLVDGPELARMRAEIRWLLAILGPARDTEVFVAEILDPVAEHHKADEAVRELCAHWAARRDHDLAAAVAAVAERRFTTLLLDLGAWVEDGDWCADPDLAGHALGGEPLAPFARKVLDKQARRMRKTAGKSLARLPPAHLHEVRILGKQLRYAGEFFAPLYGKGAAKAYLGALAKLQDVLGQLNDIAVAAERLSAAAHADEQKRAAGVAAGWHEARRPELMAEAQSAWRTLRKQKKFWRK